MRVPGFGVGAWAEPEPAKCGNANHRQNHAPDGDPTDLAGHAGTAKVGNGGDPQQCNRHETHTHGA
ncbi:hypothetical protein D3C71_1643690 [compost metagenome]